MDSFRNMWFFKNCRIISTVLLHFVVTSISSIYHQSVNKYLRYTTPLIQYPILKNKQVIVFVHGRNGWPTDFDPFIDNIKKFCHVLTPEQLLKYGYNSNEIVIHINKDISEILSNDPQDENDKDTSNNPEDNKYPLDHIDYPFLEEDLYVIRKPCLGETGQTETDEDVDRLVEELKIYENCKIILVALSKGGNVIMRYITRIKDPRIQKGITISSPVRGTEIASLFPPTSPVYKSLSYKNDLVREVKEKLKLNNIPIYHIVPKWDFLLIPNKVSYYKTTPEERIYRYNGWWYGHPGILYCLDVSKATIRFIKI